MKRFFDLLLAVILLPFFLLAIAILALLIIVIDHYSPFYFNQYRIGRNKKKFRVLKLQAMKPPKTNLEINDKEKDRLRATWLGDLMRDHGWDEFPQVFNVLLGNMSFVGPRPLLKKNLEKIKELNPGIIKEVKSWEEERSQARPGLSGWHQVHRLNGQIIKYDTEYLDDPSIKKHAEIFLKSMLIVIIGKEKFFNKYQTSE